MMTRKLLALVFPEGLLLLVAVALVHWGAALPSAAPVVRLYPVAVLAVGLLLAWRFQRGRLLLALCGLALADRGLFWLAPADSGAATAGPVVVRTIAVLLTVSLAALAFVGERGLLTVAGIRRLGVLAAQVVLVLAVWLLTAVYPEGTTHAFDIALVPHPALVDLPLGQPVTLVASLAIAVLAARTLWRPDAEQRGFLWAAIGCVIAMSAGPDGGLATLYLANAALVLVVAAVESAYAMAYQDELTGLPARRALNDALLRVDGMYTVAMVDVDHFKKFNDTHGHDVGDVVIRGLGEILKRQKRNTDVVARFGGEEFVVLCEETNEQGAMLLAERIREDLQKTVFHASGGTVAVTCSVGTATFPEAGRDWDALFKSADEALYTSKRGGRNRSTAAHPRPPESMAKLRELPRPKAG